MHNVTQFIKSRLHACLTSVSTWSDTWIKSTTMQNRIAKMPFHLFQKQNNAKIGSACKKQSYYCILILCITEKLTEVQRLEHSNTGTIVYMLSKYLTMTIKHKYKSISLSLRVNCSETKALLCINCSSF